MAGMIEAKLAAMGLQLPPPHPPVANYVGCVRVGTLAFVGGVVGWLPDGTVPVTGKVGREVTVEQAYESAKHCCLNHLAILKQELGDLDRIERIVKVVGYVASAEGFIDQPKCVNGESDLLVALWGDNGRHARLALGISEIGLHAPVETEITVLLKNEE